MVFIEPLRGVRHLLECTIHLRGGVIVLEVDDELALQLLDLPIVLRPAHVVLLPLLLQLHALLLLPLLAAHAHEGHQELGAAEVPVSVVVGVEHGGELLGLEHDVERLLGHLSEHPGGQEGSVEGVQCNTPWGVLVVLRAGLGELPHRTEHVLLCPVRIDIQHHTAGGLQQPQLLLLLALGRVPALLLQTVGLRPRPRVVSQLHEGDEEHLPVHHAVQLVVRELLHHRAQLLGLEVHAESTPHQLAEHAGLDRPPGESVQARGGCVRFVVLEARLGHLHYGRAQVVVGGVVVYV
mmetsp:Transcript_19750/g.44019  ORF Transcript_19750/g.44019 Transcript_19750/m.44019 type:complete len:294 (+) Transcript_19750:2966-3847(+)